MSIFYIKMQHNHKVMVRVNNRAEYLALRNSDSNRAASKEQLVQMAYSCLPNEDGTLKGTKRMSMTIGMDVDRPSILPKKGEDGYLGDTVEEWMANVPERILAKKDELGLLMLESSYSKGYHLVFKRNVNMSQEENLNWASNLLGVKYDKGAKDITRVFYTPADKLIYLDDEIFKTEEFVTALQCDSKKDASNTGNNNVNLAVPQLDTTASYQGYGFADIINKYWAMYNNSHEPTEGDREVKTYELALALRPICDYNKEKLMAVIPVYDGLPLVEYHHALDNALSAPRKGMPYCLRMVLKALKEEAGLKAMGGTMTTPPEMPKKLPKLIKLLTKNVPSYYKPAVANAVFSALAAHLHGVKFRYWDNVLHEATLMTLLIAPFSSGKGAVKAPLQYIVADIIERDKISRMREAEWKRNNPTGKSKPKDPRPSDICVQVLTNDLTNAALNQRVVDADANGERYLYSCVDEIEQLKSLTSKGTAEGVSLLIRNGYDNEMHGQERVGSDSVSGVAPLRWVFNASSTPVKVRKFFKDGVTDGTISRLSMCTIIYDEDTADDPVQGIYDEHFVELLKPFLERLEAASGLVECKAAHKLSLEMKQERKDICRLYESDAYRTLSKRGNVIAWLKGMVLYIAEGKWTKEIAEFVRWSAKYDMWCKMLYFGNQLDRELAKEHEIQQSSSPQNLLDMLADEFTKEEYRRMRVSAGKSGDGESTLRQWKCRGYIDWDDVSNTFHKTEEYLASHLH